MKMKKIVSIIISITLVIGCLGISASASDDSAKVSAFNTALDEFITSLEAFEELADSELINDDIESFTTYINNFKAILADASDKATVVAAAYGVLSGNDKAEVEANLTDDQKEILGVSEDVSLVEAFGYIIEVLEMASEMMDLFDPDFMAAIEPLSNAMNDLPEIDDLTIGDKSKVVAARKAYDDLSEDVKELLSAFSMEEDSIEGAIAEYEAKITALEKAAADKAAADKAAADKAAADKAAADKAAADKAAAGTDNNDYGTQTGTSLPVGIFVVMFTGAALVFFSKKRVKV